MAYTDYEFYEKTFYGNVVPDSDFMRVAERASDFIDAVTFGRLIGGLPDNDNFVTRIEKAVCAVAEDLYLLELAQAQALDAVKSSGSSTSSESSGQTGAIKSVSAGSESISYETAAEKASTAKSWSAALAAAGDITAEYKLLYDAAKLYLMGVRADDGTPVLYAGV